MPRLTRSDKLLLDRTGNAVRMYVAVITFVFPLWAVMKANQQYAEIIKVGREAEIPRAATYGTIVGIYLPIFAAVAAYIWSTHAFPEREQAPNGFAMALFRDLFTVLVVTVMLYLPVGLYGSYEHIQSVNTLMVWYQSVVTAVAGGAFAYYFHAGLGPAEGKARARKPRAQPRSAALTAAVAE
ncbi:MAG TPA: hypothetical protein VFJ82_10720 [Longimicrobium sp.]|nr:hypothetical protein [Longimicrobium sp.]